MKLLFSSDVSYTEEEHRNIYDIVNILQGNQIYTKDEISSNCICELIVDSGLKNIEMLNNVKEPLNIKLKESKKEQIKLFKTIITLPRKVVSIKSVLPKINKDTAILKEGDVVTVEWIPCDGSSYEVYYEKNK